MKTVGILFVALLCVMMGMLYNYKYSMLMFILYWIIMISVVITLIVFIGNKRWKQIVCLLLSFVFLSILFFCCGIKIPPVFREVLDHHSSSISESKKAGVYVCEYKLNPNSMGIRINEAFLEYMHTYKNDYSWRFSINKNAYLFIINIANGEELKKKGYGKKWTIEGYSTYRIFIPKEASDTITIYLREKSSDRCFDSLKFARENPMRETQ